MSQKLCRSTVVVVIINMSFINPLSMAQSAVGELLTANRSGFITALPSLNESLCTSPYGLGANWRQLQWSGGS